MNNTLFVDLIARRAQDQPDGVAYVFFQGLAAPAELTFHQLWLRSASLARVLTERQWRAERILLICKSNQHFVVAFFACLLAGCVAVPTAPPRRQALRGRLDLLTGDARPAAVIADCDEVIAACAALPALDMRALPPAGHAVPGAPAERPRDDDLAFLQYTSGSTGDPKGVAVSHGNLMHNCRAIAAAMAIDARSSILTALPLFHDMGLIGGVLVSMYAGCRASFLPPAEFVQRPWRWLQLISSGRVSHSGGPNFMFDLALRATGAEHLEELDLSSWRVAFCGAEPVRAATASAFSERFGRRGFAAGAFYPCYGMAEATLLVSGHRLGQPLAVVERDGHRIVGCGPAAPGTTLAIVDPASGVPVPPGQSGEIWVSGPGVARGYWGRPELSAASFAAALACDPGRRYLRTGDIGFLQDGQLYVSGRLKDLVIIHGKKFAPQDLELEAERSHPALAAGGAAAFSVDHPDRAALILVCELRREWLHAPDAREAIAAAVRKALSAAYSVQVEEVVLLKPGALPRTSSGKLRRGQCRHDHATRALPALAPLTTA